MDHLEAIRRRVFAELRETKILQSLFSGVLDPGMYSRYLINAYHYAQYSPKVMALAASRCVDTHPELASYLLHHADEERGHDAWALEDLRDLNVSETYAKAAKPVPACASMIGYVHYIAGFANPVGLFGWMFVLEAVGNDLGTLASQHLAKAFSSSGSARGTRFVSRHGVSDTDHTKELIEQIQTYVRAPQDMNAVSDVAEVIADLYTRMFRELGEEKSLWQ